MSMFTSKFVRGAALVLIGLRIALAAPTQVCTSVFRFHACSVLSGIQTTSIDPRCPQPWTTTVTETLSIIAPTTTGPLETTTFTVTELSYPLTTSTSVGTYVYSGPVYTATPIYTTEYTTTYITLNVYSDFKGPFPSDCAYQ